MIAAVEASRLAITHDEALTYAVFITKPWRQATTYSPIQLNHVLLVVLSKISTTLLPVSVFTLRLPSIAAAFVFSISCAVLLYRAVGDWRWTLAGLAAVALNPYMLDFFAVARGYGLMVASIAAATALLIPNDESTSFGRDACAGVLLGLAIAALQSAVVPAAAIVLASGIIDVLRWDLRRASIRVFVVGAFTTLPVLLFVVRPALHLNRAEYFVGAQTVGLWSASLVRACWTHAHPYLTSWSAVTRTEIVVLAVGAATVALIAISALRCVGTVRQHTENRTLVWIVLTMAVAFLITVALHVAMNVRYPQGRTALYWLPWLVVGLVITSAHRSTPAAVRVAGSLVLAALLVNNVVRFGGRSHPDWTYDAGSRRMMERIVADHHDSRSPVTLAGSWELEPALNFYKTTWHLDWLVPMERGTPEAGHDYYALVDSDRRYVDTFDLTVSLTDDDAQTVLAQRRVEPKTLVH